MTQAPATATLVFSDDFEGDGSPDTEKWNLHTGGGGFGNNEWQTYTDSTDNARVENGKLIIEAKLEGETYTSAKLVSRREAGGSFKYGRVEVKAQVPGGQGAWPAIWLLPTDTKYGEWPASGEIDMMESVGWDPNKVHASVHTGAYNHMRKTQKTNMSTLADLHSRPHLFRIDWSPDYVRGFVDDKPYFVFPRETACETPVVADELARTETEEGSTRSREDSDRWPFDQEFHLILNVAVGGTWGGVRGVDPGVFPQRMEVHHVRVWSLDAFPRLPSTMPMLQRVPFFISSVAHDMVLGSTPDRVVDITRVRESWQHWVLVDANDGFFVRSLAHEMYLGSTPDGLVDTTPDQLGWQKWKFVSSAVEAASSKDKKVVKKTGGKGKGGKKVKKGKKRMDKGVASDGHVGRLAIRSVAHNTVLSGSGEGKVVVAKLLGVVSEQWGLESVPVVFRNLQTRLHLGAKTNGVVDTTCDRGSWQRWNILVTGFPMTVNEGVEQRALRFRLRSHHGTFLTVVSDGVIQAVRPSPSSPATQWEMILQRGDGDGDSTLSGPLSAVGFPGLALGAGPTAADRAVRLRGQRAPLAQWEVFPL